MQNQCLVVLQFPVLDLSDLLDLLASLNLDTFSISPGSSAEANNGEKDIPHSTAAIATICKVF